MFKARWPSGLRRQTKALISRSSSVRVRELANVTEKNLVRKGVGSNPTLVILCWLFNTNVQCFKLVYQLRMFRRACDDFLRLFLEKSEIRRPLRGT